jgi:hypothetical protein
MILTLLDQGSIYHKALIIVKFWIVLILGFDTYA